jgi:hypothetical protein
MAHLLDVDAELPQSTDDLMTVVSLVTSGVRRSDRDTVRANAIIAKLQRLLDNPACPLRRLSVRGELCGIGLSIAVAQHIRKIRLPLERLDDQGTTIRQAT